MPLINDIKKIPSRIFAPDPPGLAVHELKGIPGNVQRLLDDAAVGAGKKLWRGMIHSIGSGLGKGVIIAALVVLAFTGIGAGFEAAAANLAFTAGFSSGIGAGITSLFSAGGAAILGIGGVLGAIMEIRQDQSKLSAEIARVEANAYEISRQQGQIGRSQELANSPTVNYAARELAKRDMPQQALGK